MLYNLINVARNFNIDARSGLFPIHCYTGSKSLLESVHSTKTLKEKRLKVDVCNS